MGIHARHLVGRVFHGAEARELLAAHKRDSHGDKIKLNVPEGFENKAVVDNANALTTAVDTDTAVSVVYVTLPQTFSGSASYVTMTDGDTATTSSAASVESMSATALQAPARASISTSSYNADEASYLSAKSAANAVTSTTSSAALFTAASSSLAAVAVTTSSAALDAAATVQAGTPIQATRSPSATAGAISETSNGMSGGAKAGLAFGIIIAIALAAGLIFFCWRRKKSQKDHEQIIDEKHGSFADTSARSIEASHGHSASNARASVMSEKVPASLRSSRTASTAPRLSLRPVTQFLPSLMGGATAVDQATKEKPRSAWEREPANAHQNPFEDAAVLSEKQARPESPPSNPFDEGDARATGAVSAKHTPQSSWEGSQPPTPKSAKFGTASAVAVAATGTANTVAPPRGPNNVHRVQLDFKPSMEDELELRSGQLVRMLHEYDDGWVSQVLPCKL